MCSEAEVLWRAHQKCCFTPTRGAESLVGGCGGEGARCSGGQLREGKGYLPRPRCGVQGGCPGVAFACAPSGATAWGRVVAQAPRACSWVSVPESTGSRLTGLSGQLVDIACRACEAYLGRLEHEDIDLSEDAAKDLTEDEWKDLTQQYYRLIQ